MSGDCLCRCPSNKNALGQVPVFEICLRCFKKGILTPKIAPQIPVKITQKGDDTLVSIRITLVLM